MSWMGVRGWDIVMEQRRLQRRSLLVAVPQKNLRVKKPQQFESTFSRGGRVRCEGGDGGSSGGSSGGSAQQRRWAEWEEREEEEEEEEEGEEAAVEIIIIILIVFLFTNLKMMNKQFEKPSVLRVHTEGGG